MSQTPSSDPVSEPRPRGLATTGVHAGSPPPEPGAPVVPPVVQSSTFYGGSGPGEELRYSRYGNNPNQRLVGAKVAEMEGMEAALPLASGMGATAMTFLALAGPGDHVVASAHLYGSTRELLEKELPRRGVETTFVEPVSESAWKEAVRPTTTVLFMEIPTNPTLRVFDPRIAATVARSAGARLVVDATFASPVNLRVGEHGAEVVIHSATKYLGGHSDLVAGVVAGPAALIDEITRMMVLYGPALDPHAAWLLDRGLRTLTIRMRRQNESALLLARWLEGRDGVSRVLHPGLSSHPDHSLATELMDGFGGMVSLVLEGGGPAADAFAAALTVARVAPSLGGVETLVSQPRYTSHRGMTAAQRAEAAIPDGFVRVSVGVEDPDDLLADLRDGLAAAREVGTSVPPPPG